MVEECSPEIPVADTQINEFIRALQGTELLFDFATDFYYRKSFDKVEDFTFTDQDYRLFKDFAQKNGVGVHSETENYLKKAKESQNELLTPQVLSAFEDLEKEFQEEKIRALDNLSVAHSKDSGRRSC